MKQELLYSRFLIVLAIIVIGVELYNGLIIAPLIAVVALYYGFKSHAIISATIKAKEKDES